MIWVDFIMPLWSETFTWSLIKLTNSENLKEMVKMLKEHFKNIYQKIKRCYFLRNWLQYSLIQASLSLQTWFMSKNAERVLNAPGNDTFDSPLSSMFLMFWLIALMRYIIKILPPLGYILNHCHLWISPITC